MSTMFFLDCTIKSKFIYNSSDFQLSSDSTPTCSGHLYRFVVEPDSLKTILLSIYIFPIEIILNAVNKEITSSAIKTSTTLFLIKDIFRKLDAHVRSMKLGLLIIKIFIEIQFLFLRLIFKCSTVIILSVCSIPFNILRPYRFLPLTHCKHFSYLKCVCNKFLWLTSIAL